MTSAHVGMVPGLAFVRSVWHSFRSVLDFLQFFSLFQTNETNEKNSFRFVRLLEVMAADDVPFKSIIPIIYCNFMADYIIYSIIIRTNKTKRNGTNKTERNENDSLRFVRFFVKFFIEKNERNERIGTFANPGNYGIILNE